ncbi:hypothetical protein JKP88DRAFT_293624 [Tribonema minus]|uniref:Phosphatidic acid phosphatase type 2/haloperoxidase domain-containing protein n=1 Tax=Tribonema minus TaxID=303371 RepID=A0A836CMU6_9STRA|nr:hypothetical protein JKP88DRAFT_293624 [Tribonema minus]
MEVGPGPQGYAMTFLTHIKVATSRVAQFVGPTHLVTVRGPVTPRLEDAVEDWRRRMPNNALVVFAQGATTASDVVIPFQKRIFELQRDNVFRPVAMDHWSVFLPVAMDHWCPLPFHSRTATGTFLGDVLVSLFIPWSVSTVTLCAPLKRAAPQAMADACFEAVLAASTIPKAVLEASTVPKVASSLTLFDKAQWVGRISAGQYPGHRTLELRISEVLQSLPCRWLLLRVSLAMHFALQEAFILMVGAVAFFAQVSPLVLTSVARAATLVLLFNHILKLYFKMPRPAWSHLTKLRINPYALKLHQYDYTFPSGHSSFMVCLWTSLAGANDAFGYGNPVYFHVIMAALTLLTGFTRMYLSLHFAGDVLGGWLTGALIGWFWTHDLNAKWLALAPSVQLGYAIGSTALAGLICVGLVVSGIAAERKRIAAWRKLVGDALLDPLKASQWLLPLGTSLPWLLPLGMYGGVFASAPQYTWIATDLKIYFQPQPEYLRILYVAVGLIGLVLVAAIFLVIPRNILLRRWLVAATARQQQQQQSFARRREERQQAPVTTLEISTPAQPTEQMKAVVDDSLAMQEEGKVHALVATESLRGRTYKPVRGLKRAKVLDGALFFFGIACVLEWIFVVSPIVFWQINKVWAL